MSPTDLRVRVWGGRNTHAAEHYGPDNIGFLTPCNVIGNFDGNHVLPADTPVTCPACIRRTAAPAVPTR
jgi:hypothetical protein